MPLGVFYVERKIPLASVHIEKMFKRREVSLVILFFSCISSLCNSLLREIVLGFIDIESFVHIIRMR